MSSGSDPDDFEKAVCTTVFTQLCGRFCIRKTAGSPGTLDWNIAGFSSLANSLFSDQLSINLFRNCTFQPLRDAHSAH